jgi:hypothetical protein
MSANLPYISQLFRPVRAPCGMRAATDAGCAHELQHAGAEPWLAGGSQAGRVSHGAQPYQRVRTYAHGHPMPLHGGPQGYVHATRLAALKMEMSVSCRRLGQRLGRLLCDACACACACEGACVVCV